MFKFGPYLCALLLGVRRASLVSWEMHGKQYCKKSNYSYYIQCIEWKVCLFYDFLDAYIFQKQIWNRRIFYTIFRPVVFHVNCGCNSGWMVVINLITLRTFFFLFLPLPRNCAISVYLCVVELKCSLRSWR
jgi:hypothetical protein